MKFPKSLICMHAVIGLHLSTVNNLEFVVYLVQTATRSSNTTNTNCFGNTSHDSMFVQP